MSEPNSNDKDPSSALEKASEIVQQAIQRRRYSRPYRVFRSNMKSLRTFVSFMAAQQKAITTELQGMKSEIKKLYNSQELADREEIQRISKKVSQLQKRADEFLRAGRHMWIWQPVHMVTFIETYLQDLLAEAAAIDPNLMAESAQTATYSEVTSARSVQSLAGFIRHKWARNWVDSRGPRQFLASLERMGAKDFPEGADLVLEEMWGVRHVVVHRSGLATRDFVERHPTFGARPGQILKIPEQKIRLYYAATKHTVGAIDEYAMKRWPGLSSRVRSKRDSDTPPPDVLSE